MRRFAGFSPPSGPPGSDPEKTPSILDPHGPDLSDGSMGGLLR